MSAGLKSPIAFEKGDKLYLVGPVGKVTLDEEAIKKLAFGAEVTAWEKKEIQQQAGNPNITWMQGQYVEADLPNNNGDQWQANDLAIKSLTPLLMPVTVMHNLRTAVGTIADAKLLTPHKDSVPRSKIETTLALWTHRFADVVEEALDNAEKGTLMQSMECQAPTYSCSVCGMLYERLPFGAEAANWCAHLNGEAQTNGSRILANVCFTGTGLIFGSRGAAGADPEAHLEVFQETVAEAHTKFHRDTQADRKPKRRKHHMETVEISKSEYDELKAAQRERDELKNAISAEQKKVEEAEAAQKKAEGERDTAKTDLQAKTDEADKAKLAKTRLDTLGDGFRSKLGDNTRQRVEEQAASLKDEEWEARLVELEELTSTKRDAKKDGEGDSAGGGGDQSGGQGKDLFEARDVTASSGVGASGNGGGGDQPVERSAVVGALARSLSPGKQSAEDKS